MVEYICKTKCDGPEGRRCSHISDGLQPPPKICPINKYNIPVWEPKANKGGTVKLKYICAGRCLRTQCKTTISAPDNAISTEPTRCLYDGKVAKWELKAKSSGKEDALPKNYEYSTIITTTECPYSEAKKKAKK